MNNITKLSYLLIAALMVTGCSKIKEKIEEKVDDKINKEIDKTSQQVNEQLKQADSLSKIAGEQLDKETKKKDAIEEETILKDPEGQWAITSTASSSYAGDRKGKEANWSADQMTGAPDVNNYGDDGNAWASKDKDKGIEWVELTFPKAVYATEVRVRQNYNPGAIVKVALIDEKGNREIVWDDVDKTKYKSNAIQYFIAKFDKSDYKTKKIRITLATNTVPGWNEIDAVQLVGTDKK